MKTGKPLAPANLMYRCAGPNCGTLKGATDHWWLMWTSFSDFNRPVLYLCTWDDGIAAREGTLHVCGELCAQRLQSQFMGNVRENLLRRSASE
ncbi:MAG TPA: hypothetical protein VN868_06395 [Terriglobales bacterium]|jgi:hypothetical protein|nr:hypothetical protein [Terriglobales bacterium]